MLYVDSAVIVAALSIEPETETAQLWLAEQDPAALAISDWVRTEVSGAMARKVRMGQIVPADRDEALRTFAGLIETMTVWAVSRADFETAARLLNRHELGLRTADALHLAIASGRTATLCTLDRQLVACGRALGIDASLL